MPGPRHGTTGTPSSASWSTSACRSIVAHPLGHLVPGRHDGRRVRGQGVDDDHDVAVLQQVEDVGPAVLADERLERHHHRTGLHRSHPQQVGVVGGGGFGDDQGVEDPTQLPAAAPGPDVTHPPTEVDQADPVTARR